MEPLLRVKGLSKSGILNDISFEMGQGEMLAVMGPSGSGKPTLLYNVSGMDQPASGEVWLRNTEITGLAEDQKARLRLHRMGFVFQQMNMMTNLNILDNILLSALHANRGRKMKAVLQLRAQILMEKLSISGLEERKITEVSGGAASACLYLPESHQ